MLLFRLYERLKDRDITMLQGSLMEIGAVVAFLLFYMSASEIPKVYRYSCYYWLPVAMVILSFALQRGILSEWLNNRLMVTGGEISYSFYLIHLFILLSYAEWQKTAGVRIEWYYSVPVLFVGIILLSLLSYRCFERPMNRKINLWLDRCGGGDNVPQRRCQCASKALPMFCLFVTYVLPKEAPNSLARFSW